MELTKLAAELAMPIMVCHMPLGTSKWNKIEHRLFSHISMNWAGQPLTGHDVVVNLIEGTTTRTGLRVKAECDEGSYPRGIKISGRDIKTVVKPYLVPHDFYGEWSYTINAAPSTIPG